MSDYYPFGYGMPSRTMQSGSYRYGFNGKEKDQQGEWGNQTHYDYGARIYNPSIGRLLSVDPLIGALSSVSPYTYAFNSPLKLIDPDGKMPVNATTDPPVLYHNTTKGKEVIQGGFNAKNNGRLSNYNWFTTELNAGGTGRQGHGAALGLEGINVESAELITRTQTDAWRREAMKEMGHTEETWKTAKKELSKNEFSKLHKERAARLWSKVGKYMDNGKRSAYKIEMNGHYAVSDAAANKGRITTIQGKNAKNLINSIKGTRYLGKTLIVIGVATDVYRIATSENRAKTITKVAGGWTGAAGGAATAAAGAASMGIDFGGPVGWLAHGVISLGGGMVGYFVGEKVTETVYEILETKGWVPGGEE